MTGQYVYGRQEGVMLKDFKAMAELVKANPVKKRIVLCCAHDEHSLDAVYEAYPNSGGFLLDAVHNEIKTKKKKVKSPLGYVLGYAKKVGWDDKAEHFEEVL